MEIDSTGIRKKTSRFWYILFSAFISIGFGFYFFRTVSLGDVAAVFRGIDIGYVFIFILFSFAMSLCRTWRYSLVIESAGYQTVTLALFLVTLVRNFFSDLLPARLGTLIYIYLVQARLGLPFGVAAASFALSFIFDILSLGFLIIPAALLMSSEVISSKVAISAGVFLALASVLVLYFLPLLLSGSARVCNALPLVPDHFGRKISKALAEAGRNLEATRRQRIFWKIFFLSVGVRGYKYLSLYALLLALVIPLGFTVQSFPFAKVFLGLCSAELAASLPVSGIAGFGAYEGAWAFVFQLLGYSKQIALLTSVSHHLITQIYGYLLGALALLILMHPGFQGCFTKKQDLSTLSHSKVWLQIAGSCFLLLICLYFVFPFQGTGAGSPQGDNRGNYSAGAQDAAMPEGVSGKFVFQSPQGLYIGQIGSTRTRKLTPYGTHPRWSPDGKLVAFIHANKIMLIAEKGGSPTILAEADKARALCFAPDGLSVYFTDGKKLRSVDIENQTTKILLDGYELLEIDVANNPYRLAATVRKSFGYAVYAFDLKDGSKRAVADGCSASLSPDGSLITVNGKDHRVLYLYHWDSLNLAGKIHAPAGEKFDNQLWSNDPDWLSSVTERSKEVFISNISNDKSFRITRSGNCERAELFVTGVSE